MASPQTWSRPEISHHRPHRTRKTTINERILYYGGRVHKMGEVHDARPPWMDGGRAGEGNHDHFAVTSVPWAGHTSTSIEPRACGLHGRGGKVLRVLERGDRRLLAVGAWSRSPKPSGTRRRYKSAEIASSTDGPGRRGFFPAWA